MQDEVYGLTRKQRVQGHIRALSEEVLAEIKDREGLHPDRWVPAGEVKAALELNFVCVPKAGRQYGEKGWLFAILARLLEDRELVEFKKFGSRSYYRSR